MGLLEEAPKAPAAPLPAPKAPRPAAPPLVPTAGAAAASTAAQRPLVSANQTPSTPLPKAKLFVLCLIQTSEGIALSRCSSCPLPYIISELDRIHSLLPFVPIMILDEFRMTDDPRDVGFLVGAFGLAQFASSFAWGALSDRVGRRPVLLVGLVGTFFSINAFGFSKTYAWAMVSRTLAGALNGNLGVLKAYLGEITDKTNQARAFALIGLNLGLGTIIGPTIGGNLCQPALKYPSVFRGTLFERFPYLLPTLVSTIPTFVAFVVGIAALTETLPRAPLSARITVYTDSAPPRPAPEKLSNSVVFRDRKILCAITIQGLSVFIFYVFEELFPVWSVDPPEIGGLGFSSFDVGLCMSVGGVVLVLNQIFLFPYIVGLLRLKHALLTGLITIVPIFFLTDLGLLARAGVPKGALIAGSIFLLAIRYICGQMASTSAGLIVNNSAPPSHLGAVNGLGQAVLSLFRALGLTAAGAVFAWSLSAGLPFPLDAHFVFVILFLVDVVCLALGYSLPESINRPRQSWAEKDHDEEGKDVAIEGFAAAKAPTSVSLQAHRRGRNTSAHASPAAVARAESEAAFGSAGRPPGGLGRPLELDR